MIELFAAVFVFIIVGGLIYSAILRANQAAAARSTEYIPHDDSPTPL